jgi:hypothetical protein
VSSSPLTLISSKPRVYLLKDGDPVGLSAGRSVFFSEWTVLIGRTGFETVFPIPDPTLSLRPCISLSMGSSLVDLSLSLCFAA